MNKYAQVYLNAYVNKMGDYGEEVLNDDTYNQNYGEQYINYIEPFGTPLPMSEMDPENPNDNIDRGPLGTPLPMSEMDPENPNRIFPASNGPVPLSIQTGVNSVVPTMGLTQGISSLNPSLQDRWSKYHGTGAANAYNPNSKRDVAMLKAMEAAQGGGERAIRAVADGPLSRPARRPAMRPAMRPAKR